MPSVPIAAFLAGALLSLLLPVGLLCAIAVWHMAVIRRAPGPVDSQPIPPTDPIPEGWEEHKVTESTG